MFATARQMVVEHIETITDTDRCDRDRNPVCHQKFLMTEDDDMAHAPVKKHADMNKDENVDEKE